MRPHRARAAFASILLVLSPALSLTKIKKIKPNANPPQYLAFSKLLPSCGRSRAGSATRRSGVARHCGSIGGSIFEKAGSFEGSKYSGILSV
jgi:hypothetical protein